MTLRETSAVQQPVVVLCGTRRHDSCKSNHYTKLKCSSVNSESHSEDTVFGEKIPCVQLKKKKKLIDVFEEHLEGIFKVRCTFYLQYGSRRFLRVASKFPSQYMTSHAGSKFFPPCNVKVRNDKRDFAQGNCKNGKKF